ncbi:MULTISPECIES: tetratricopeptide repeat protein [unclassified Anabaena]|uniref:serine/threonine-protein kinase n=1 Tax=unclassified Anabaena TaxID=2619674 RepID=UPI001446EB2E|nr:MULTISPECIES: serine/threonine-protein kinase [unclassified Anabaena]MTJ09440.1 tetratricopeptide repeat protein [Anabaena sp. UHCC 0204]MTJ55387.1 tetratricopeptide repeat protein [Anabaena sp. UHCC 0253]
MIGNILRQRYRIIKQLGAGGFGETFLAEDLDIPVTPKPICVVKKLHPTIIDPEIIRLFEQEAQILYQLGQNHDQIPKLSGYFQEDQDFYLIQEFIDGYDLTQEITPGKKLNEGEAIQFLRDVLEILVYVHENKVIHRDIKPANIMRRKDGKLVLIDFGVVKQINTTIAMKSGLTSKTVGVGTHGYMPPEQGFGKPKLSSDIYALGMTAIEGLTGISLNTLSEDEEGEIIWSNLVSVSNKLENFITKMVRYDWRQRYKDAKEALEELNQVFSIIKQQNRQPVTLNQSSQYWFEQGIELIDLERYEEAISYFDKAIAINPDDHDAWFHRGTVLDELQRYREAIASYDKAIAINPDDHEAWYNRGIALGALRKYTEAIASYDKAIAIKADYHEAWSNRGVALEKLQKYTEAITSYDKGIAIKADFHEAWYNRGVALEKLQKYTEAIASYDKAIAIKPDFHEAWHGRGISLRQLQKYEEAIASYDKAIAIKPDDYDAWHNRGVSLRQLQKYEEAIASYDKAIAIKPDKHEPWTAKSVSLWYLQRYEEALKCCEKAISIKPDFELAIKNRNNLLKQLGR